jgi:hypothetical protein
MGKALIRVFVCLVGVAVWNVPEFWSSGLPGVYAIVERVVFEPDATAPQRIQVWGVFSVTDGKGAGYLPPQKGYLYFVLPPDSRLELRQGVRVPSLPIAVAEWKDLKTVAGSGSIVAFAEPPSWSGRVRKPAEKPTNPDVYPVYNGITRLPSRAENPTIAEELRKALK